MKYFAKLDLCVGHPNQYGDCESCYKKVTHHTYSLVIYKEIINPITGKNSMITKSHTYGHEECLNGIIRKYGAELIK